MIRTWAAALALSVMPAHAAGLDELAWMTGAWSETKGDTVTQEQWLDGSGGLMLGAGKTVKAGKVTTFELMRIEPQPTRFRISPTRAGSPPGPSFAPSSVPPGKIVFENKEHDFPQRVVYWRDGESLMARIEGSINGQPRSRQWRYDRVK
jgi:hypothetical protein